MKKSMMLVAGIAVVLGVLVGCAPAQPDQAAYETLDEAIHDVERVFVRFLSAAPDGPAQDIVTATEQLSSEWAAVTEAAEGLEEVDVSAAQAAHDALVSAVADVPGDATAREALAAIDPLLEAFKAEVDLIHEALDLH